ncbi:MAG: hypothetical protein LW808_001270 [Verrucomicrobiota bacterium]|nr:MAG: hypothetical protein LW808_001270 [Verrucomicrobiota bacterium]
MSSPIEGVSGDFGRKSSVETIQSYNAHIDAANEEEKKPAITSNFLSNDMTSAADSARSETPVSEPPKPGEAEVIKERLLESFEEAQEIIQEDRIADSKIDTDKDGIPDHLDATGNDTLIEQAYDEAAKRIGSEQVQAFVSVLAMLNNFDLTNYEHTKVNGDPMSLSAIATAGCAQMALIHSAKLNNSTEIHTFNQKDLQKMLKDHQRRMNAGKKERLEVVSKLVAEIPTTKDKLLELCPQLKNLPKAECYTRLNRMLKNLEAMKKSLITPASAEA